jgi:hypothetical protein
MRSSFLSAVPIMRRSDSEGKQRVRPPLRTTSPGHEITARPSDALRPAMRAFGFSGAAPSAFSAAAAPSGPGCRSRQLAAGPLRLARHSALPEIDCVTARAVMPGLGAVPPVSVPPVAMRRSMRMTDWLAALPGVTGGAGTECASTAARAGAHAAGRSALARWRRGVREVYVCRPEVRLAGAGQDQLVGNR